MVRSPAATLWWTWAVRICLKPARAVNPKVKIIIKYPLWYDSFHERGYEVVRESKDYDYTWIGTETRDYDYDVRPGGEVQYNAYFISRWINKVSGGVWEYGGGWVDALGVTPRICPLNRHGRTIIGNEQEIMLFHYGSLLEETNEYDDKPGTPDGLMLMHSERNFPDCSYLPE